MEYRKETVRIIKFRTLIRYIEGGRAENTDIKSSILSNIQDTYIYIEYKKVYKTSL